MHYEAVSVHFCIYLGLGIYGCGACLHSLHPHTKHTPTNNISTNTGAAHDHLEQLMVFFQNTFHLFCSNMSKSRFLTIAKPQDHSKSIGHRLLLLIHGLKPHIDLVRGPNMKFSFFRSLEITSVLPVARTTISFP